MNRPTWYNDHPDACTCTACEEGRVATAKVREAGKVGRNSPCPCNSGKKFKKCHGR